MKKTLIFLTTLTSAVFVGLLSANTASAYTDLSSCDVNGPYERTKAYCAGSLYRLYSTVEDNCKKNRDDTACLTQIKSHLVCYSGTTTSTCNERKTTYGSLVSELIRDNEPDPCDAGEDDCTREDANWKWYYNSKPAASADDGEGDGDEDEDGSEAEYDGSEIVTPGSGECTSILPGDWCTKGGDGIEDIVRFIITILTGAIVVAGTIGIIFCGVIWMRARENEAQVATAKKRMLDIAIGMIAWILLSLLANLFIPKSSADIDSDISQSIVKKG